jgi:PPOX class probable F420-dependent enzyme
VQVVLQPGVGPAPAGDRLARAGQVVEGTPFGRLGDLLVDPRGEADFPWFALRHAGFHASAVCSGRESAQAGEFGGPFGRNPRPSRMIAYFSDMDRTERREFVRKHRTCIFGYNRRKDGPAMTVVYYVLDGDDLLISTMAARAKALAVRRNPKVSLCILDEQWPLTYLQVYGDAALEEDFGQAVDVLRRVIDLMAEKDVTSAKLPEIEQMAREENRVVIRVRPYATFATPPRHVYKAEDIDTLTHFTSNSQPW